jgi:uncharacterized membrane protein
MHKIGTAVLASTIFIGPIAGAGLPFLAVGYAVYWLVRRRREANGPMARMRAEAATKVSFLPDGYLTKRLQQ